MDSAARRERIAMASRGFALAAAVVPWVGCTYDVSMGSVTYSIPAQSCGTWDRSGVHTAGTYLVGHTVAPPNDTIAYFVFDFTPVKGRTITRAGLEIPGTSDWQLTVPTPENPPLQFKVSVMPLPAGVTLAQVTEGSNDATIYADVLAEAQLGFAWTPNGSSPTIYGAFTYDGARLQDVVDTGGLYPLFAVQGYRTNATTAEYFYGSSVCTPDVALLLTLR